MFIYFEQLQIAIKLIIYLYIPVFSVKCPYTKGCLAYLSYIIFHIFKNTYLILEVRATINRHYNIEILWSGLLLYVLLQCRDQKSRRCIQIRRSQQHGAQTDVEIGRLFI